MEIDIDSITGQTNLWVNGKGLSVNALAGLKGGAHAVFASATAFHPGDHLISGSFTDFAIARNCSWNTAGVCQDFMIGKQSVRLSKAVPLHIEYGQTGYTWTVSAGELPPDMTLESTGLISGTPTATGTYNFTVQVTDSNNGVAIQAFSLTIDNTPYAIWATQYFTPSELADPSISGNTADPTGDGISNLVKFAFNLNPFTDGYQSLPQPAVSGDNLVLTFQAKQSTVTYTVEASTDLINWSTNGVTVLTNGNQVTATYPLPVSGMAFLRIFVAQE